MKKGSKWISIEFTPGSVTNVKEGETIKFVHPINGRWEAGPISLGFRLETEYTFVNRNGVLCPTGKAALRKFETF